MPDAASAPAKRPSRTSASTPRTPPFLPTPLERLALGLFPLLLVFGTVFSILSPETRAAPYDHATQSHAQSQPPSYFARKSNVFNIVFVKRGWGWTTFAFVFFLFTHPSGGGGGGGGFDLTPRRFRAGLRWALVTAWWFFVTQWCFGAPIIDRGFRWTGGRCERAHHAGAAGETITAVACKAAGGRWAGGHDISGHVFLLVLATAFLMNEVGWSVLRWSGLRDEERCVIMPDGALKSANVEADAPVAQGEGSLSLGPAGKMAVAVAGLNLWMLLMTAIYFHTWFEKLTGLVMASVGIYAVYILPRFVPALRAIIGLPGI